MINESKNRSDEEIDLSEIIGALWAHKIQIFLVTVVFALGSVIYALSIPNKYESDILLVPAKGQSGVLSGAMGRLSGLASLAGVDLGSENADEIKIALHIMKSWYFVGKFIAENDLSAEIVAVKSWNKDANRLVYDEEIYQSVTNSWILPSDKPSEYALFKAFQSKISISHDKLSGLVTVRAQSLSPHLSKRWLDLFVTAINIHMQERQVASIDRNIQYLEQQIEESSINEMREVLYSIIEDQIKERMIAKASPDYTFIPVSPAMVPQEKSSPKRAMICIWGTMIGGMLSVFFVLLGHFFKRSRS